MDIATDQLDALIERRARSNPDVLEPSYAESVRRYHARRRDRNRWAWIRFYDRLAQSHARISADYEARAEALLEEAG